MKTKNNLKMLLQKQKEVKKEYFREAYVELKKILDSLIEEDIRENGIHKDDLCKAILHKSYVTEKELRFIYQLILRYRKEQKGLIYLNGKYGFPKDRLDLEAYYVPVSRTAQGKLESLKENYIWNCKRLNFLPENSIIKLLD